MGLETSKIELVKLILSIDNATLISKVVDFIQNEKQDFWKDLSEKDKLEITKGIEQLNNGNRISYKEALKKIS